MTIKGLTDDVTPRFPRLGKLRKGGEKTSTGFGPDLNHFRFTSERPDVAEAFIEAYGEAPAMLPVFLPYATPQECFQSWKEKWAAGGMQHRCDGVTCEIWLGQDGKYHRDPKPCPGGCEEVGRLELILPHLWLAGFVGFVTLETHSINDILAISQSLGLAYLLRQNGNLDLRGMEFTLRRVPEKISVPGFGNNQGKRQRVEKWMVKIEPATSWVMLEAPQAIGLQLPSGEEPAQGEMPMQPAAAASTSTGSVATSSVAAAPENGNLTLEKAAAMKTPKGAPFSTLTDEQLALITARKAKDELPLAEAAKFLLEGADGDDWHAWYELMGVADTHGIRPDDLPVTISRINLLREMNKLYEAIGFAEATK